MGVTIKQVAHEAGVSIATVSRVLNGKGPVLESTRKRILKVAQALRYVPHGGARSLITNRTSTVGVLLPDIYGEFFSELIRGLDSASRRKGYHLLVSSSHGDPAELEAVIRATRGRVDGLIVMTPDVDPATLEANLPEGFPLVTLSPQKSGGWFDSISVDNHAGAMAMVHHLASLGHRRVAFVRGPSRNLDARERLRGFRDAARELGLNRGRDLEIDGDFSEESGYRAGGRIATTDPRPTAVFAANDAMAIGVLMAMREAGVSVPGDIAIAGFDDIPLARFLSPPLTSVRVPVLEMASRAMGSLFDSMEKPKGERRPHRETLEPELVVRESCGAPARRGGDSKVKRGFPV